MLSKYGRHNTGCGPISFEEKGKIESFYSSYGTSLYTAGACACLYTMTNLKSKAETIKFFRSTGFPYVQPIRMHCSQAVHYDWLNVRTAGKLK